MVCMDFEPYFQVHNLVSVHLESIILGRMTNLNMVFYVLVSVYRLPCEQLVSPMRELVTSHVMHLMPSSFVNNFFAGSVSIQENQNVSYQKR